MSSKTFTNTSNTICFTNYFCNKSSSRSLKNNKMNILLKKNKCNVETMLKDIFGQQYKSLIKDSHFSFNIILLVIRNNFQKNNPDDFGSFFDNLKQIYTSGDNVDPLDISKVIIIILEKVVPNDLYGINKNKKAFFDVVRFVLKGMLHQHITFEKIIHKWDINSVPWLKLFEDKSRKTILCKLLIWIIKNVVCSTIAVQFYVTVTKLSHECRKLYYFFKKDWQSLTDIIVSSLLEQGHLVKCDSYSLGNKSKKTVSLNVRKQRKSFLKTFPVLRILLKPNFSVRVIIRYKKLCLVEKRFNRNRRNMLKCVSSSVRSYKFEEKYVLLFKKWKEFYEPKLYFVKADLTDAFGSVDMEELRKILSQLHKNFQNNESDFVKKQIIAKEYQKLIIDLKRPIYIRIGSCAYKWNHGLIQGMRFSPILCEIFYNEFDQNNLQEFTDETNSESINFFFRYVDDYLFITDNILTAFKFVKTMMESGRINPKKTVCNFDYEDVQVSPNINFLGFRINSYNLEITRNEHVYSGQLCYRILFNQSISNTVDFLEKRIAQTTIPLNSLYFNLKINSEATFWTNVFKTLCISANKFCTIVTLICCNDVDFNAEKIFDVYKRKVAVSMCNLIIRKMFTVGFEQIEIPFCINHFRYIAFKVLCLFACKSNVCADVLSLAKIALKKSSCFEGPWQDHSSSIEKNGTPIQSAKREICRRIEIKKYFQTFNKIPKNFEAYSK